MNKIKEKTVKEFYKLWKLTMSILNKSGWVQSLSSTRQVFILFKISIFLNPLSHSFEMKISSQSQWPTDIIIEFQQEYGIKHVLKTSHKPALILISDELSFSSFII